MTFRIGAAVVFALTLAACAGPPPQAATEAPTATAADAPTVVLPTVVLPTATDVPPSATPAPTSAPATATAEPEASAAAPSPTVSAEPTPAGPSAIPTAPLFFDPTTTPGGAAPSPTQTEASATPAAAGLARPAGPDAGGQAATSRPVRLVIEGIDLDRGLVPVGLDANRLPVVPDHDIGWYTLGAQPGQGENIVLWGHVLRFRSTPDIPAPFARLKDLKAGDRVTLFDAQGARHSYVVTQQVWATPDQVEYMLPRGREQVTMISCIGDKVIQDGTTQLSHRLITIAEPERG